MKFIADAMLGRLARWLRLLGFDTLYIPDISDAELLRLAKAEGRHVLTRDTGVVQRGVADCLLVESEDVQDQLKQVFKIFGLVPAKEARCPLCNGTLSEIRDREELAGEVPAHVQLSRNRFYRCTECGNIYWEGSHTERMKNTLDEIFPKEGGD